MAVSCDVNLRYSQSFRHMVFLSPADCTDCDFELVAFRIQWPVKDTSVMKIAVLGYSGSGKSTLARFLSQKYDIPVLHIDTIQFKAGWQERELEEKQAMMKEFLDLHDSWVIDGNYTALMQERRLEEADLIILMLFNRFSCYFRAWKRYFHYRGKSRPDMAEGCPEKVDWEFTKWIFHDGRTESVKAHYDDIYRRYHEKFIIIHTQKELEAFMGK